MIRSRLQYYFERTVSEDALCLFGAIPELKKVECTVICQKGVSSQSKVSVALPKLFVALTGQVPDVVDCNPFWEDPRLMIMNQSQQKAMNKARSTGIASTITKPKKDKKSASQALSKPAVDYRRLSLGNRFYVVLEEPTAMFHLLEKLREFYIKEGPEPPKSGSLIGQNHLAIFKRCTRPAFPDSTNPIRRVRLVDRFSNLTMFTSYELNKLAKVPDVDLYYPALKEVLEQNSPNEISDLIVKTTINVKAGTIDKLRIPSMYDYCLRALLNPSATILRN